MDEREFYSMNEELLWECVCGKTEFDTEKLEKHVRNEHNEQDQTFQTKLTEVSA